MAHPLGAPASLVPRQLARRSLLRGGLGAAALVGALAACTDDRSGPASRPGAGPGGGGLRPVSARTTRGAGDPTAVGEVADAVQLFGGALLAQLSGAGTGDVAFSPSSVAVALGMAMAGARGETRDELAAVLGVAAGDTGSIDRWHGGLNALRAHLDALAGEQQRPDGTSVEVVLRSADQIFGQAGVAWADSFLDVLARQYGAGLLELDLSGDPEAARTLINDWVAEQTDGLITDLLPDGSLDRDTVLVLVDALRLVAPWRTPFQPSATAPGRFQRLDGSTVEVPMMRHPALAARLVDGEGWWAARIPYAGDGLAMSIVVPGGDPRADAARSVAPLDLEALVALVARRGLGVVLDDPGREETLEVRLPRWRTRSTLPLRPALERLGVRRAFGDADLTGMTAKERLVVSDVVHQGYVSVDESGTEAAAATAVTVERLSLPVSVPFVVDRPFLYVVHDVEHGVPLFVGRVLDPSA